MKTFKYKLYRSKKNEGLCETINLTGRAYNYTVVMYKRYYRLFGKTLNHQVLQKHMTFKKHLFSDQIERLYELADRGLIAFVEFDEMANRLYWKYGYMEDIPSQALQQVTERVRNSYKLFFENRKRKKKCSPPGFKSSRRYPSFTLKQAGWAYEESGNLKDNKIIIGKKCFKFHKSRSIEGEIKTLTIKRDVMGNIFICFSCALEPEPVMTILNSTTFKKARAIDFGLKDFLVLDDGSRISSPEFLKNSLKELKVRSRAHSRKQNGSGNREASRKRLAKLHEKIANQRLDWARKTAHAVCKSFDGKPGYIFVEDLNLSGMRALWGRKVSDVSYGMFVNELSRIAEKYQIKLVKVGRFEKTTGVCSETGLIKQLTLADRSWECECGKTHDRDHEAARTILKAGLSLVRDSAVRPDGDIRQAS